MSSLLMTLKVKIKIDSDVSRQYQVVHGQTESLCLDHTMASKL